MKIYAYAMYELGNTEKDSCISIELWFVDEQKKYTQTLDYQTLKNELLNFWKKVGNLSVKNTQHCQSCQFENLCHFQSDSFARNL